MKPGRIFVIVFVAAVLGGVPQDKSGFLAGIMVGSCLGAVGALFALSQGAKHEEEHSGETCAKCGR
jgi:hypothetical protein